jgi:hypothetical protein
MKRILFGILLTIILASCGLPEKTEKETKVEYKIVNLEEFTESNDYVVDQRTGCLYFRTYGTASSGTTVINDEHGKQVGCRKIENVTTVEEYFDK